MFYVVGFFASLRNGMLPKMGASLKMLVMIPKKATRVATVLQNEARGPLGGLAGALIKKEQGDDNSGPGSGGRVAP